MQTRSQRYAQKVYDQLANVKNKDADWVKSYGRWCNRFPILVLENGLAQTIGFLHTKAGEGSDSAEQVFLGHVAEILEIERAQVLNSIIDAELANYRRYTRHALAAAIWYKRFAQSVLGVEVTD